MNIFKILASGDGSINEPNVSAFLGYLLNPKEDHGIRDELLKKILFNLYLNNRSSSLKEFLIDKHGSVRNLSINSNFHIEVLLEQAFTKHQSTTQIVDIVLLCFEKKGQPKESLAKIVVSNNNKGQLKQIFLIENKIHDSAAREGQLTNQCLTTISTLSNVLEKSEEDIKKILSTIFISPDARMSNAEFEEFDENYRDIPKIQLHWNKPDEDEAIDGNTILYFLRQILIDETDGRIEAINEQTKFTIKSFIGFVDNDFKSSIEEELEGETIKEIDYDFPEFGKKQKNLFSEGSWDLIEKFQKNIETKYPNLFQRHSPTHPVSIFIKERRSEKVGKKVMSLTRSGRNICLQLVYRNHNWTESKTREMNAFLDKFEGIDIKDTDKIIIIKFKHPLLDNILKVFDEFYNILLESRVGPTDV